MKTFRFIGIALFSILICVNFSSCSSSDDDPTEELEESGITKEKKLMEIKLSYSWGGKYIALFSYDKNGRLISNKNKPDEWEEFSDGHCVEYTWGNNIIMGSTNSACDTYKLANGLIVDDEIEQYQYNSSNKLTSISNSKAGLKSLYQWENGNLINVNINNSSSIIQFSYSNETCKGYFPLMASALFYKVNCSTTYYNEWGLVIAHPELMGIKTKQLPNKITETRILYYEDGKPYDKDIDTYSIEYTFTTDGYIETCTIESNSSNRKETMIATFKWQ